MDSTPSGGVWSDIRKALETPAGKARARELARESLGLAALAFPSVRIVQAVLPLIQALLNALNQVLVPSNEDKPSPQVAAEDWVDYNAAKNAVRELKAG